MAKLILCFLLFFIVSFSAVAQEQQEVAGQLDEATLNESGFTLLPDLPTKNQIPLFNNRFRIDHNISEITLLLFRRPGTSSVVLVRPDGSKIHFNTASQYKAEWHDARNYDLIRITDPMPGPWQAIGRLLPESRILVLTDIRLEVDALPDNLLVGETVKITARLTDNGQQISVADFRDVLTLEVVFISTNNSEYDNFGKGIIPVAQLKDDGQGYDEKARDGIFTGEYNLKVVAGEWIPKYIVRTPLYTREMEQAPVLLGKSPVAVELIAATTLAEQHELVFSMTEKSVVPESILLQGRVRYPDGDVEGFTINETDPDARRIKIQNKEHGSYIVDVAVFGETLAGREFMLTVPESSFIVEPILVEALPEDVPLTAELPAADITEEESSFPWGIVIAVNLVILISGAAIIWFVMADKTLSDLKFWQKKTVKAEKTVEQPAMEMPKEGSETKVKPKKNNDMDDILDLSLPDD